MKDYLIKVKQFLDVSHTKFNGERVFVWRSINACEAFGDFMRYRGDSHFLELIDIKKI